MCSAAQLAGLLGGPYEHAATANADQLTGLTENGQCIRDGSGGDAELVGKLAGRGQLGPARVVTARDALTDHGRELIAERFDAVQCGHVSTLRR